MPIGKRKRILFVSSCPSEFWAGCEHLWSEACFELNTMNQTVGACHFQRASYAGLDRRLLENGIEVFHHQSGVKVGNFFRTHHQLHFEQVLKQFRPQLVLISEGQQFEGYFFMSTCKSLKIPYAVVTHAVPSYEWQLPAKDVCYRMLYEGAVKTFFVSEVNLLHFKVKIQSHLNNASVIRNPFGVPYDQVFQWPDSDDTLQIGMVGSAVVSRKGQDIAFDIFSQEKWKKRKLRVTMFTNGNLKDIHRLDRIKCFLKASNINIVGYPANILSIWKTHHLLLCASRREGLPISIVEAMLCGRPCLVTDVDGNPELIEDNQTGYICRGYSYEELDNVLEKMFHQKEQLSQMGQAAFSSIRTKIPANPAQEFAKILFEMT